jgi:hypothetical protein
MKIGERELNFGKRRAIMRSTKKPREIPDKNQGE